ncbi:DUF2812 domain-containing protein [Bhargavaea cecembensis]|uniref:DUF2812 domain-containing protein n=1 Tax=Bhargavaea cecembensis TaxID=394098 RepID=UPI00058CF463|nr:DUF2812 domain-containing protein [Bhargavaea cecembensis]
MKKTKYITSGGLAFSEEKDMKKLQRFSREGWHLKDFAFMGYTLEKGEPADFIYSIDYRTLEDGEEDEYLDVFDSSGWSHVASAATIHLFRAPAGTKPLYTDRETTVEKYGRNSAWIGKAALPLVLLTGIAWAGAILSTGILNAFLFVAAVILTVMAVPAAWTALTAYENKWKAAGRIKAASLAKVLPFLIVMGALIAFVGFSNTNAAVKMFLSMLAGALALPLLVWAVMASANRLRAK